MKQNKESKLNFQKTLIPLWTLPVCFWCFFLYFKHSPAHSELFDWKFFSAFTEAVKHVTFLRWTSKVKQQSYITTGVKTCSAALFNTPSILKEKKKKKIQAFAETAHPNKTSTPYILPVILKSWLWLSWDPMKTLQQAKKNNCFLTLCQASACHLSL